MQKRRRIEMIFCFFLFHQIYNINSGKRNNISCEEEVLLIDVNDAI